jgi:hypothetical protein
MQLSHEESVVFTSSKGLRTKSEVASSEGIATSLLIHRVMISRRRFVKVLFRPADVS